MHRDPVQFTGFFKELTINSDGITPLLVFKAITAAKLAPFCPPQVLEGQSINHASNTKEATTSKAMLPPTPPTTPNKRLPARPRSATKASVVGPIVGKRRLSDLSDNEDVETKKPKLVIGDEVQARRMSPRKRAGRRSVP